MTTDRRLLPAALVLLWAGTLHAQATAGRTAWTSPCTLDVVLVTLKDTTGQHQTDTYDYGAADLPHGYMINDDGALVPEASTYKYAYPRENGITGLSGLTGLADLNAGEHIPCALTFTT